MGAQAEAKLVNDPQHAVREMLEGLVALHDHMALLDGFDHDIKVVVDRKHDPKKVAVISGGGSGHEPLAAGYVGAGMLAGAVCGDVFASPSTEAVLAALRTLAGPAGCLLLWLNYTGDCLNFGLAQERAEGEGVLVERVVVADDCGVPAVGIAGCRGIAGMALVMKVAGAAAAEGRPLGEVRAAAEHAAASVASMGAALSFCSLPGAPPQGRLPEGTMELGLGIHGEAGALRCPVKGADGVVGELLQRVLKQPLGGGEAGASPLAAGDAVALLVNNLGATTAMELHIVLRAALRQLQEAGIEVRRAAAGPFVTSLNMAGASLSVMRLDNDTQRLLDADTAAPGWPHRMCAPSADKTRPPVPQGRGGEAADAGRERGLREAAPDFVRAAVRACAAAAAAAEPEITRQDVLVGDGDCGATVQRGCNALIAAIDAGTVDCERPARACLQLADAIAGSVGGTSGALYRIFFTAASRAFSGDGDETATVQHYASALAAGVEALGKHGGAGVGDRSMMDALIPAAEAARKSAAGGAAAAAAAAAKAAREGKDTTKDMPGRAGRSSYVGRDSLLGTPDPGAFAVAVWLGELATHLHQGSR